MNPFVFFQTFDVLANSPEITEAFCRKWRELSAIPIRLRSSVVSDWLSSPDCCGAVLPVGSRACLEQIKSLSIPVINYSGYLEPLAGAVNVRYDSAEIGEIAAEHLCEQGFQHFAFLENSGAAFSASRREGFRKALQQRGHQLDAVFQFDPPPLQDAEYQSVLRRSFADWLAPLPKSIGILAANDAVARAYCRALQDLDAELPALQALVGIDDDYPVWVRFNMGSKAPPLSSIRLNYTGVGESCAQLLHAAVTGQGFAPGSVLSVHGAKLIRRESSGGFSCDDPLTAQLARMAAAAVERGEAPNVQDLQNQFPIPARILAERFRQHAGRPLREFIIQLRLQRAARLLRQSDLSISEIAQKCGFNKHADLTERFGKYIGCTPSEYRSRCS